MKKKGGKHPKDAFNDIRRLIAYMDFATKLKIAQEDRKKKDCNK